MHAFPDGICEILGSLTNSWYSLNQFKSTLNPCCVVLCQISLKLEKWFLSWGCFYDPFFNGEFSICFRETLLNKHRLYPIMCVKINLHYNEIISDVWHGLDRWKGYVGTPLKLSCDMMVNSKSGLLQLHILRWGGAWWDIHDLDIDLSLNGQFFFFFFFSLCGILKLV